MRILLVVLPLRGVLSGGGCGDRLVVSAQEEETGTL